MVGGRISGEDNGLKVHDVDGNVRISNSFGGKIRGDRDNGVDIDDVEGDVRIDNVPEPRIEQPRDAIVRAASNRAITVNSMFRTLADLGLPVVDLLAPKPGTTTNDRHY